jgi:hypothetical protein
VTLKLTPVHIAGNRGKANKNKKVIRNGRMGGKEIKR